MLISIKDGSSFYLFLYIYIVPLKKEINVSNADVKAKKKYIYSLIQDLCPISMLVGNSGYHKKKFFEQ